MITQIQTSKQLGLTQPQLALVAGVGVGFIVDLEAGKPTHRLETVLRVIDTLSAPSGLAVCQLHPRETQMAHELEVWLFQDHLGTLSLANGSAELKIKRSRSIE